MPYVNALRDVREVEGGRLLASISCLAGSCLRGEVKELAISFAVLNELGVGGALVAILHAFITPSVSLNAPQIRDYVQANLCPAKCEEDASLVLYKF